MGAEAPWLSVDAHASEMCLRPTSVAESRGVVGGEVSGGGATGFRAAADTRGSSESRSALGATASLQATANAVRPVRAGVEYLASARMRRILGAEENALSSKIRC